MAHGAECPESDRFCCGCGGDMHPEVRRALLSAVRSSGRGVMAPLGADLRGS